MTTEATEIDLNVRGMSCSSCAAHIERGVAALPGVRSARVNFATGVLHVVDERRSADALATLVEASVHDLGYEATRARSDKDDEADERRLYAQVAITGFFAMAAMLPAAAIAFGPPEARTSSISHLLAWASAGLAAPAFIVGGWNLSRRAIRSVRDGAAGMDALVATGASVTAAYSLFALLRGEVAVYFDTAAMILMFALLGRALEARARRRGLDAVRALERLLPRTVHRLGADGREEEIDVAAIALGDRVRVRAGERAGVEGNVIEGASLVDAAIVHGEWAPRKVTVGDRLEAGMLLQDGTLVIEADRLLGARGVDLIQRSVERLLASPAPMQRLADLAARRLATFVLGAAALTLVVVGARHGFGAATWMRAVSVVVVACPCALGLASPIVVVVAAARAAARSILFRDADALERAAAIDRVYLDKTGTLTEGRPRVTGLRVTAGVDREEAIGVAATLERSVEHPLARAIRAFAEGEPSLSLRDVVVTPGEGVRGVDAAGRTWSVGAFESHGVSFVGVPGAATPTASHVLLSRDGAAVAIFDLDDAIRAQAKATVAALAREGLRPALLTGDRRAVAEALALAVGIRELSAEQSPLAKADAIRLARERGEHPAFVGDGLNDGVALAAADLGIAVEGATDLAIAGAHVAILHGGVERVPEVLAIARVARRRVTQNLAWASAYNLLAIPAAALGWLSPALAAALMAASSVSVVLNALRDLPEVTAPNVNGPNPVHA